MESNKDIGLLIKSISAVTGLSQGEIAKKINYSSETLSRAKKKNDPGFYHFLEQAFAKELATANAPALNPERALLLAMLQDYAEWKAEATGKTYQEVKEAIKEKGRRILDDLDSWRP